jgi:hypothetical protein
MEPSLSCLLTSNIKSPPEVEAAATTHFPSIPPPHATSVTLKLEFLRPARRFATSRHSSPVEYIYNSVSFIFPTLRISRPPKSTKSARGEAAKLLRAQAVFTLTLLFINNGVAYGFLFETGEMVTLSK